MVVMSSWVPAMGKPRRRRRKGGGHLIRLRGYDNSHLGITRSTKVLVVLHKAVNIPQPLMQHHGPTAKKKSATLSAAIDRKRYEDRLQSRLSAYQLEALDVGPPMTRTTQSILPSTPPPPQIIRTPRLLLLPFSPQTCPSSSFSVVSQRLWNGLLKAM